MYVSPTPGDRTSLHVCLLDEEVLLADGRGNGKTLVDPSIPIHSLICGFHVVGRIS